MDDGFTDIVAEGYDVGIRFASGVDKDMIAVGVGPEIGVTVVASPACLNGRTPPATPRDLVDHRCIVHRRVDGSVHAWPLRETASCGSSASRRRWSSTTSELVLDAAVAGQGVACVFENRAAPRVADGTLIRLLDGRRVPMPGYAL